MFGFRMVGSIAIALALDIYGTDLSKTEHPNTEHENVRFSNRFGFLMVGIRAPTVLITELITLAQVKTLLYLN